MVTISLTPRSAVVFDMDGVIVDSREAHFKAWQDIAAELGAPIDRAFFLKTFGMRNVEIFELLKPELKDDIRIRYLDGYKEKLYRGYFSQYARPLPGLTDALVLLKKRGVPCGIGTSAPRANVDAVLDRFGIHDYFLQIVTSEDVLRGKPAPEVFVRCMALLQSDPADTVIFEDSPGGIKAAVASRARTVAIGGTHSEAVLRALGADDYAEDFREVVFR
jgi:beta-phosphoglucomutase